MDDWEPETIDAETPFADLCGPIDGEAPGFLWARLERGADGSPWLIWRDEIGQLHGTPGLERLGLR